MKRVFITGVAGFIGSTLAEKILETGDTHVVGIDSLTSYYSRDLKRQNIAPLARNDHFTFIEGDLNKVDLPALIKDADTVFHQAGQPGVRPSWGSSFLTYTRDNIDATQVLLEAVKQSDSVQRVIYASSSSIYGDAARYPTVEADNPAPMSPYGVTKLAAEHLMFLYAKNFSVPTVSLRYFTVYGPRQRPDMGFTKFITKALTGRQIDVYGDGSQVRDFTYVDDIVAANIAAAEAADLSPGEVFNVSGGSSVSLNDTFAVLEGVIERPLKLARTDRVAGDVQRTGGSSAKAATQLGWQPAIGLHEGLQRQVAWLESRLSNYAD